MTLEILKEDKIKAMKAGFARENIELTAMIDAVQQAAITSKGRIEITEQLVDETLIKYQKTIQEMIDTCPPDRETYLWNCQERLKIVMRYAPQLLTDKEIIKQEIVLYLINNGFTEADYNKGKIMKAISPIFKGRADMKIVNQVVSEIIS